MWLTGLPSSGKTTLARGVARRVAAEGIDVAVLDGDDLRRTVNADLGFSRPDREENVRRVASMAAGLLDAGTQLVVVAVVAPYQSARDEARARLGGRYWEVYVSTPVEVCAARDGKGLYTRQQRGELAGLTGVDDPYEVPTAADLVVPNDRLTPDEAADAIVEALLSRRLPR